MTARKRAHTHDFSPLRNRINASAGAYPALTQYLLCRKTLIISAVMGAFIRCADGPTAGAGREI